MGFMTDPISLRLLIGARIREALALVLEEPARPIVVRVRSPRAVARLVITSPAATDADPGEAFPGVHFSPLGAAVWGALADGPLPGKKIAARCGMKYTPSFAVILKEYVTRGVLGYNRPSGGYFRKVITTRPEVTTKSHSKTR